MPEHRKPEPLSIFWAVMLLSALAIIYTLATGNAYGQEQPAPLPNTACKALLPFGQPTPTNHEICRAGYVLDYDASAKIPAWDAHIVTPAHAYGCVARTNAFQADKSITDPATPKDYLHSGYDIGHMSPDADFSYNANLERQSFILTNTAPQLPGLNRQTWKYLEEDIRAWAYERKHPLWVITGPVYAVGSDKTIGNHVDVPTAFYKVVVDTTTHEYLAFIFPQKEGLGKDVAQFLSTLKDITVQTGVHIPLPSGAKADSALWPVNIGEYNQAKRSACSK